MIKQQPTPPCGQCHKHRSGDGCSHVACPRRPRNPAAPPQQGGMSDQGPRLSDEWRKDGND